MCTSELLGFVGVAGDLGGADVGEIEGIEEKHQVFSLIVWEFDLLEGVVGKNSECLEVGCRLSGHEGGCQSNQEEGQKIFHCL